MQHLNKERHSINETIDGLTAKKFDASTTDKLKEIDEVLKLGLQKTKELNNEIIKTESELKNTEKNYQQLHHHHHCVDE